MQKHEGNQAVSGSGGAEDGEVALCQPLHAEQQGLRRCGLLLVASDLLWIPQAGLIAGALGKTLSALHVAPADGLAAAVPFSFIWLCVAALCLLALIRVALQALAADAARIAAQSLQIRARRRLLAAAEQASPAADFPSSGAFAAHVTEQVDILGPFYRNYVPQLLRLRLVPLAIILVTAWFSWLAALILLVSGPLIPAFMALIGVKAKAANADQQDELTRLSGVLLDRIRGLETLELFGALQRTRDDIAAAGERFRVGTMRVLKIAFLSSTVLELFSALGIAFCAVYVGFSLLGDLSVGTWGEPLGYGAGLFVLLLAPEYFSPLRAFAAAYHDRAGGLAAQDRLRQIERDCRLARPTADARAAQDPVARLSRTGAPAIRIRSASLVLGGRHVFRNLDLEIAPGETVFLTGESGSGKSSLMDCILGFHDLEAGEICIDGVAPGRLGAELRNSVMWLGQAPRLFHGSVRANLLKGATYPEKVTSAELWEALDLAGAADLVRRLPQGLATQLGEDGFGLSVGEIRRLALARAALRRDAVLVLADEPTAALDEDTAADVIRGLKQLASGRTTLIATHDPAVLGLDGRRVDLDRLSELAELAGGEPS